jgi:two-component system chemotaxis response regulator CheY
MNMLIVEDDPVSGTLLKAILSPYGSCDSTADGLTAVRSFEGALKNKKPYDLICLDIMLPDLSGQEALKRIRELESARGIAGLDRVKIIMVTALGDGKNVMAAFRSQCEGYIVKPIRKDKIIGQLKALDLIEKAVSP